MRIRSTGLGEQELVCESDGFSRTGDYLLFSIRTTEPVRWHVRVVMDGRDMLHLLWQITKALFAVSATLILGLKKTRNLPKY